MDVLEPSTPRTRALAWVAVLALTGLVAALLWPTLSSVDYYPTSDDGYYLRYMTEVAERGLGAIPEQFRFYLGDRENWIYPPPSRVGFTLVSAACAKALGARFETLTYLSFGSHLAAVLVHFLFARRWFEQGKALLVAALLAFATLHLGLARLALTDSFVTLVQVTTAWLFFDYVRDPTRRLRQAAFALAFTFAILTKEIAVLLAIPFAAYAAIERFHRKREVPVGRTIVLLAVPGVAALAGWIAAAGSPMLLARVMKIVLLSPATNTYAIEQGSGGWYRYPIDEILMSPSPTLLGLAGIAIVAWRWRRGEYGPLAVAMAILYVSQIAILGLFTKNLRYVAVLEMPLRVLAVILLWEFLSAKFSRVGLALCSLAVAGMCWIGWTDFQWIWIRNRLYDPMTSALTMVRGMSPSPGSPGHPR